VARSRGAAIATVPTPCGTEIAVEGTECELSGSQSRAGGGYADRRSKTGACDGVEEVVHGDR
jgi:hypothetical protein